jgi:hypothetical protein
MKEQAENKITETRTSKHENICRIIYLMQEGLQKDIFGNIGDKLELAEVLQTSENYWGRSEIIELNILFTKTVGMFKLEEQEEDSSLQAAMLASTASNSSQEQAVPYVWGASCAEGGSGAGGETSAGGASFFLQKQLHLEMARGIMQMWNNLPQPRKQARSQRKSSNHIMIWNRIQVALKNIWLVQISWKLLRLKIQSKFWLESID